MSPLLPFTLSWVTEEDRAVRCCPEGSATAKKGLVGMGLQRGCLWGEWMGGFVGLPGLFHLFAEGLPCPQVQWSGLPGIQPDGRLSGCGFSALKEASFLNTAKHPACEEGSACSQKTQAETAQ